MEIELILRDIYDLIHDVKTYQANAYEDRRDADRTFTRVEEGYEYYRDGYETVASGLVDASQALDRAKDRFGVVEEMLLKLINDIEREALSHKVQSR